MVAPLHSSQQRLTSEMEAAVLSREQCDRAQLQEDGVKEGQ